MNVLFNPIGQEQGEKTVNIHVDAHFSVEMPAMRFGRGSGRQLLDAVDPVWIKRQAAGDGGDIVDRMLVAPDCILGDPSVDVNREVRCLAFVCPFN
jgi:hypothetical protein